MNDKVRKTIAKRTAMSLLCYGTITPDVWRLYKKYKDHVDIDIKIHKHKVRDILVFQIEFLGNLKIIAEELAAINLNIIKNPRRPIRRFFSSLFGGGMK